MPREDDEPMERHDMFDLAKDLDSDNVISDEDMTQYVDVILDSLSIHLDRERIRHGLWKEYPAQDQMRQIKIKVERALRSLEVNSLDEEQRDAAVEEMYDIINYANFSVRILKGLVK